MLEMPNRDGNGDGNGAREDPGGAIRGAVVWLQAAAIFFFLEFLLDRPDVMFRVFGFFCCCVGLVVAADEV